MTGRIASREYANRCPQCHYIGSRYKETPFENLRLPLWMFGYVIEECVLRHPHVLSAKEIQRRLGVAYGSARLLKQRVQLLAAELQEPIRKLIHIELKHKFKGVHLPRKDVDLTDLREKHQIPAADSVVLFSASQRANGGRKRFRHSGQSASIFMSDKLGGKQVGTLTHVFSWKNGPIHLEPISDLRMETVSPILDSVLPPHAPVFTDEGYKFYYRKNRNHRMVNHSARSKESRHRWARDRWCRNGVHNQVAEGNARKVKQAFSAYGWISPKYSKLYLSEYSFIRNLRYFGLERIAQAYREHREQTTAPVSRPSPANAPEAIPRGKSLSGLPSSYELKTGTIAPGTSAHSIPSHARSTDGYVSCSATDASSIDGAEDGACGAMKVTEDLGSCAVSAQQICPAPARKISWLRAKIQGFSFHSPTLEERRKARDSLLNPKKDPELITEEDWTDLRCAMSKYDSFSATEQPKHRKSKERFYSSLAETIWETASRRNGNDRLISLEWIARTRNIPLRSAYRVVRRLNELGAITLQDVSDSVHRGHHYYIGLNLHFRPRILFMETANEKYQANQG